MNAEHVPSLPISASAGANSQGLHDSTCSSAAQAPIPSWGEGIIHYVYPAKVDVTVILQGSIDALNREAWDLKKKVERAREAYDCEMYDMSHNISEAVCAVDCAEHDITKLKARIRFQRSQTQEQTHELRDLNAALEEAKEKVVYYRELSQELFDDVRLFEGQLLHVMMQLQLWCHDPRKTAVAWMKDHLTMNGYTVVENPSSVPVDTKGSPNPAAGTSDSRKVLITPPQEGHHVEGSLQNAENVYIQVDAPKKGPIQPLPYESVPSTISQSTEAAQAIQARSEDTSDCIQHCALAPCSLEPSTCPSSIIEHHFGPEKSKPARSDSHHDTLVRSPRRADVPVAIGAAPATPREPTQQENTTSPEAEPAPSNEAPNQKDTDEKTRIALEELEQCENQYWDAGRNIDTHETTYDEQWTAFYTDHFHPNKRIEVLEDAFAQEYLHRRHALNAAHTLAEQRMKAARLRATEAGVEYPNTYGQESDFLDAPGEGPSLSRDAQDVDGTRVRKWLCAEDAVCKLEVVEARFALEGAHVETWESSSSRGDVGKRKRIEANDEARKRRKVDGDTLRRRAETEDEEYGVCGNVFEQALSFQDRPRRTPVSRKRALSEAGVRDLLRGMYSNAEEEGTGCVIIPKELLRFSNVGHKPGHIPVEMREEIMDLN
ncbi:hypothetical protein FB567DRAFT_611116 [Paraphoma chrysanthemicola]|uniref:Uncharacterized protein n=1 Tax=Paraphoma chrysanthemicola TaxID=798071 RepID=A0A8K0QW73_9PLEO|nr:hypothetical protein FB567DRAFT_611116 [Paraphoma chrysanthemicola]